MGVNPNEALSPSDRKKKWAKRDSKKARRAKGKKLTKRELELTKKESVNEDKERKLDDLLFSKGYDVWGGNTAAKRYWKRNGLVIEVSHKNGRNKYHVDYKLNVTPLERLSETSIKDAIKYAKEIETKIRATNEAKLSSSKQKQLDALIDEFGMATDPDNEYIDGGWEQHRDVDDILRDIEKTFGKTIANQVADIDHYPRHAYTGRDKLAWKKKWYGQPKRITKKGKMHKQDIQRMKSYYKKMYK